MKIIMPYDLKNVTMQSLIEQKLILPADGNKVWQATIFPKSKELSALPNIDKDRLITQLDDSLFAGFTVLDKANQNVLVRRNTGRRYIKSVEIGDFNDSVKRYVQLDKPIDYNLDAKTFLNIPMYDFSLPEQLDTSVIMIHRPGANAEDFVVRKKPEMFETPINHPHVSRPKPSIRPFKNNNKAIIERIFKWAAEKGVKYIYCINEYRPYSMTTDWTTPYVYYTIKGSY
jgi:hypothetical protein